MVTMPRFPALDRLSQPSRVRGFTILELMLSLGILGVLCIVAIPRYQDYTRRTKVAEVLMAMNTCKTAMSEYMQVGDIMNVPTSGGFGCEDFSGVSRYVDQTTTVSEVGNGMLVVVTARGFNDLRLDGKEVSIEALAAGNVPNSGLDAQIVNWRCGGRLTTMPKKFLPSTCQGD